MQIKSTVLACLLLLLVHVDEGIARPANWPEPLTLPLYPVPRSSDPDVPPQIRVQQHMNRAYKRFARLTGRALPTDDELRHNLHRRMASLSRRDNSTDPCADAGNSAREDSGDNSTTTSNDPFCAPPVTNSTDPTTPDTLGVNIQADDVGYFTTIQIGTPLRDYRVIIDSGSADFWVQGSNCHDDEGNPCAANHAFLTSNISSTYVDTGKPWSIQYGSGDVSGNMVRDNVSIRNLTLTNHTFGVGFTESDDFASYAAPYDGLLGLALSALSNQKVITPIEALAKAGKLKGAITSYKIARVADNKHDGTITFGGLDPTKYDPSTLVTIPNVSKIGFWEGNVDTFAVDGVDIGLKNRTGIFDTGTTGILAPKGDAESVHSVILGAKPDGQGGFTLPCGTKATISLTIGGRTFDLDPRDLAFMPVDENDPTGLCVSQISYDASIINGQKQWLLGDSFLKNAYMSTDADKNTVSFAKLL